MQNKNIYKNIALVVLSRDHTGEVWVHLAEAKRGLTTFGGRFQENMPEDPVQALLNKVAAKTLGIFDKLTPEQISDPNQTYSRSYINPSDHSNTLIFATHIDHPDHLNDTFQQRKENSQTDIHAIHSVQLSQLKKYLADKNPEARLHGLSMDPAVRQSLTTMMASMENRLNQQVTHLAVDNKTGLIGKSIRADDFSFIDEFFETLPIAGGGQRLRKSHTRIGRRRELTARGTELLVRQWKKQHGIGKQHTEHEKLHYSGIQSLSYFSVADGTPVFGFSKDRAARLVGVIGLDVLPNRFYIYDGGTVSRPYEGNDVHALMQYIKERAHSTDVTLYDTHEFAEYKAKIESTKDAKYNEILGRARWNLDTSSLCVFSDNIESRWIAISWARKLAERFQHLTNYQVKISYYYYDKKVTGELSREQIEGDIAAALAIFDDPVRRKAQLENGEYDFLLIINDEKRLFAVINDDALMKKLLESRLHIAEHIIDHYYKMTGKPYIIPYVNEINFKNITRHFLLRVQAGVIGGFMKDAHQRFNLNGLSISRKDFSGMDLCCFNFSYTTFEDVYFNNAKLDIRAEDTISLKNCHLLDVDTTQLDFSHAVIDGHFVYNDPAINMQLLTRIVNPDELLENHTSAQMIALMQVMGEKIPLKVVMGMLLKCKRHGDFDALEKILKAITNFENHTVEDATNLLSYAAAIGSIADMEKYLARFPWLRLSVPVKDSATVPPLMAAMEGQHTACCQWILERQPNLDIESANGDPLVLVAAQQKNPAMLQMVLAAGADIDKMSTKQNMTSVMIAACNGDKETMDKLLLAGANINARSSLHLSHCINHCSDTSIDLLLEAGADINQLSLMNYLMPQTPLTIAILKKRPDITRKLLARGADVNIENADGMTPLSAAIKTQQFDLVDELLPQTRQAYLNEALLEAAEIGSRVLVEKLVNAGADVFANAKKYNDTALQRASSHHHEDVFLFLASRYSKDQLSQLLIQAALHGLTTQMIFLLKAGADINAKDNDSYTALYSATFASREACVVILLEHGADPNAGNKYNNTLSLAVGRLYSEPLKLDTIKLFLTKGAVVDSHSLQNAMENDNLPVLALLIEYANASVVSGSLKSALRIAGYRDNCSQVLSLLVKSQKVSQSDLDEALFQCCEISANASATRIILDGGANPNLLMGGALRQTALEYSIANRRQDIAQLLLNEYRHVLTQETLDRSLYVLTEGIVSYGYQDDIFSSLLQAGAKLSVNRYHGNAMGMLAGSKKTEFLAMLLQANIHQQADLDAALVVAVERARLENIKLLLAAGASPSPKDNKAIVELLNSVIPAEVKAPSAHAFFPAKDDTSPPDQADVNKKSI